jgi:hypothetical protein
MAFPFEKKLCCVCEKKTAMGKEYDGKWYCSKKCYRKNKD